MVFGKQQLNSQGENETYISETQGSDDDDVQEIDPIPTSTATSGSQSTQSTSNKPLDATKPLIDEVVFVGAGKSKNPGGSKVWTCNHCKETFTSTYTRIHIHFFGPAQGSSAGIRRCSAVRKDRELFDRLSKKVREAENSGDFSKSLKNSVLLKSAQSKKRFEECFGNLERSAVDLKIIRGLCANGIPFNVLRNPHFLEMINAIQNAPAGYKPPSCEKATTTLLDECVRNVDKELAPVKDTWYTQGVSIVSDGWSNVKHKPLINVLAVNSRGALFMEAQDFSGVEKTGEEIANYLIAAIEVGPTNVLQVVTDNAANCKKAGEQIEKVFKHILWSPCVVHTLNLIFKDLASSFYWLFETYKKGKAIVKFFLNHTIALSFFRENSKLELLKVAKTRFASHYILLRRLLDCREALETTIVLNSFREWFKKGNEAIRSVGSTVIETIKDELFWQKVEDILAITKPIFLVVKFSDGEGTKMGEIYERMDNMLGEIKEAMTFKENQFSNDYEDVRKIVLARWDKMSIPIHCLGFALTPRFHDKHYLQKLAPGGLERKAPNDDIEVVTGVFDAFHKIAENEAEEKLLREQFATFCTKKGIFNRIPTQADAVTMDAVDWWTNYGAQTPELAEVAKKVLSQPISSSSAERNWSTYSYIHNVKRNRLNVKRADKLVFIHSNIRLLSRFSDSYKSGPHKKWDMNPENSYIDGSSARLEEMLWEDLEENDVDNGKGKRQRTD